MTLSMSHCYVYIGRHGETSWNQQRRLQGHTDIPLNENGISQAKELKEKLAHIQFAEIHTSDLSRAHGTATILRGERDVKIVETPALRERFMGVWEGRTIDELEQHVKSLKQPSVILDRDSYMKQVWDPTVESDANIYERLNSYIQSTIVSRLQNDPALHESSFYISTHGGVVNSALYQHQFNEDLRWRTSNCSYIILKASQNGDLSLIQKSEGIKTYLPNLF